MRLGIGSRHFRFAQKSRDIAPAERVRSVLVNASLILDGEVCVFDKNLVSQFHLLDRSSDEPCTCSWPSTACTSTGSMPLHRRRAEPATRTTGPVDFGWLTAFRCEA